MSKVKAMEARTDEATRTQPLADYHKPAEPLTLLEILGIHNGEMSISSSLPEVPDVSRTTESLQQQAARAFRTSRVPGPETRIRETKTKRTKRSKVGDGYKSSKVAPRWHGRWKHFRHKERVQKAAREAFLFSMTSSEVSGHFDSGTAAVHESLCINDTEDRDRVQRSRSDTKG